MFKYFRALLIFRLFSQNWQVCSSKKTASVNYLPLDKSKNTYFLSNVLQSRNRTIYEKKIRKYSISASREGDNEEPREQLLKSFVRSRSIDRLDEHEIFKPLSKASTSFFGLNVLVLYVPPPSEQRGGEIITKLPRADRRKVFLIHTV